MQLKHSQRRFSPTQYRDFRNADWDSIHARLGLVDWRLLFRDCDVDRMWFRFKSILDYVVEKYIPLKTFTPKRKTP